MIFATKNHPPQKIMIDSIEARPLGVRLAHWDNIARNQIVGPTLYFGKEKVVLWKKSYLRIWDLYLKVFHLRIWN